MFKRTALCASLLFPLYACAADTPAAHDDADPRSLEERVRQLEQQQREEHPRSRPNAFNPEIALILSGTYGNLRRDPALPATGFALSPNNNGHTRGFSLKESELGIAADIDPQFRGVGTFSLAPGGGLGVENAFVQTSALGGGFSLKFGRFFSGLGYLNEQHAHAWDFVDQPLVYVTFWDNQLAHDGVQLKWLAPADLFIEFGGELGDGGRFPGGGQPKNGSGAGTLFVHAGDDIGASHSWRAGASLHQTGLANWSGSVPNQAGVLAAETFTGNAHTAGLDFVWKYAPGGNSTVTNFKLQGEYFRRTQNGVLAYTPLAGLAAADSYANTQSGWYLQGVYQFMPMWRAGLRHDRLDSGNAQVGALLAASVLGNYHYAPTRTTLMLDYSPSEFSRLRLQLARDNSRLGLPDTQLFLQYTMSMGAHGAHQF
ncbi:MAG TPA: hypothetical protein VIU46_01280 [Gallionellaceae bacterium]